MSMLVGITTNTTSGDVLALGMYTAEDICARCGIPPERVRPIAAHFMRESRKLRNWNPFAF